MKKLSSARTTPSEGTAPRLSPEIGTAWRWYDCPYRLVRSLQRSASWPLLPLRLQVWLSGPLMQWLMTENQVDRFRAQRVDGHPLGVDEAERLHFPTIWVVELFTTREIPKLEAAIRKNRWQRSPHRYPMAQATEILRLSRAGSGPAWWQVADLADVDAGSWTAGARREKLPEAFDTAQVHVVRFGPTLTAVVARLELTAEAAERVDRIWHQTAQPRRYRAPDGYSLADDRAWATMRATQKAQLALHDEARRWLGARVPGAFKRSSTPQTSFGLLVLDPGDPLLEEDTRYDLGRLRALGVTKPPEYVWSAAELPGLVTERVSPDLCAALGATSVHLLVGKAARVGESIGPRHGHPPDPNPTMIGRLVDSVELRNYMILQAYEAFLGVLEQVAGHPRHPPRRAPRRRDPGRRAPVTRLVVGATVRERVVVAWR